MKHIDPPILPEWLSETLGFQPRRYLLDLGDCRMHVMESGEGFPVLMLHGNPTWGFLYRKVVQALAGQPLRIILPDLVGLGFSDKPTQLKAHTLENHISWLDRALELMDLDSCIFVGQDWGGPIGMGAMARKPERLKGLVVLNTSLSAPKPGFKPTRFHAFSRAPLLSDVAFRVWGFPQVGLHRAQGDPNSIQGTVARAYKYPLKGWRNNAAPLAMARMVPNSMEHPSVAPLQQIQAFAESFQGPAAIVWGKKDPVLGKLLKRTLRSLPQARVTETEGGHFLQEEVPQEIADAVLYIHQAIQPTPA